MKNKEKGWTDKQKGEKPKVDVSVSVVTERGFVTCLLNGLRTGQTTTKFFSEFLKKNWGIDFRSNSASSTKLIEISCIDKVPIGNLPRGLYGGPEVSGDEKMD